MDKLAESFERLAETLGANVAELAPTYVEFLRRIAIVRITAAVLMLFVLVPIVVYVTSRVNQWGSTLDDELNSMVKVLSSIIGGIAAIILVCWGLDLIISGAYILVSPEGYAIDVLVERL